MYILFTDEINIRFTSRDEISHRLNTLRKNAYLNILKILPPKHETFQMKNSDMFSYFCSKQIVGTR